MVTAGAIQNRYPSTMAWPTTRSLVLTASLALLAACPARRTQQAEPAQFTPPGAPDPLACHNDNECVPGPVVDPNNGCCDTGVALGVHAKAYVEWRASWVREHCAASECPPRSSPALPRPCATQGRCEAGRCRDSCPEPATEPMRVERAILPAEVAHRVGMSAAPTAWPPTPADLDAADLLLPTCLPTAGTLAPEEAEQLPKIVATLDQYRRQVVPFRGEQGQRLLWLNLFVDASGDRHPQWRSEYVSVRGGGRHYFSILVDLDARRCSDLQINSPR